MNEQEINLPETRLTKNLQPIPATPDLPQQADSLWFYVQNKQKIGPVPLTDLRALASQGQLHSTELERMPLTSIWLPAKATGMNVLRRMKSLANISGMPAADFWKEFDAGKYPPYKP